MVGGKLSNSCKCQTDSPSSKKNELKTGTEAVCTWTLCLTCGEHYYSPHGQGQARAHAGSWRSTWLCRCSSHKCRGFLYGESESPTPRLSFEGGCEPPDPSHIIKGAVGNTPQVSGTPVHRCWGHGRCDKPADEHGRNLRMFYLLYAHEVARGVLPATDTPGERKVALLHLLPQVASLLLRESPWRGWQDCLLSKLGLSCKTQLGPPSSPSPPSSLPLLRCPF